MTTFSKKTNTIIVWVICRVGCFIGLATKPQKKKPKTERSFVLTFLTFFTIQLILRTLTLRINNVIKSIHPESKQMQLNWCFRNVPLKLKFGEYFCFHHKRCLRKCILTDNQNTIRKMPFPEKNASTLSYHSINIERKMMCTQALLCKYFIIFPKGHAPKCDGLPDFEQLLRCKLKNVTFFVRIPFFTTALEIV